MDDAQLSITVSRDDQGSFLRASLCAGGRYYEHEVRLDPIVERLRSMLAAYHDQLHRDMLARGYPTEQVSGWLSDAWDTVSNAVNDMAHRVAASKAAQFVVKEVKAHQRDILKAAASVVPGGSDLVEATYAVSDVVSAARDGDQAAQAKLGTIADMASQGDASAKGLVALAQKVNLTLAAKESAAAPTKLLASRHEEAHVSAYNRGVSVGGGDHRTPASHIQGGTTVTITSPTGQQRVVLVRPAPVTPKYDRFGNPLGPMGVPLPVTAAPRATGGDHRTYVPPTTPAAPPIPATPTPAGIPAPYGTQDPAGYYDPSNPMGYYAGWPAPSPNYPADYAAYAQAQAAAYQAQLAAQYAPPAGYGAYPYAGYGPAYGPAYDPSLFTNTGYLKPNAATMPLPYGVPTPAGYNPADYGLDPNDPESYPDAFGTVSGWSYNRPYRRVAQAIKDRSPGAGIGARELYNRGLGRPSTSLADFLL